MSSFPIGLHIVPKIVCKSTVKKSTPWLSWVAIAIARFILLGSVQNGSIPFWTGAADWCSLAGCFSHLFLETPNLGEDEERLKKITSHRAWKHVQTHLGRWFYDSPRSRNLHTTVASSPYLNIPQPKTMHVDSKVFFVIYCAKIDIPVWVAFESLFHFQGIYNLFQLTSLRI